MAGSDSKRGRDPTLGRQRGAQAKVPRVLLVEANEDGTVGGSHQVLFDVVRSLQPDRAEFIVAFYQYNRFVESLRTMGSQVLVLGEMRKKDIPVGGRIHPLRTIGLLVPRVLRRVRLLRKIRPDILHLNNSPHTGFSDWLPAAKVLGIPLVVTAMGDAEVSSGRIKSALIRRFDRYIAVSRYIRDSLLKQGIPEDAITLVPNGVDGAALRSRARRSRAEVMAELGLPEERFFLVMVGNVRPWKGHRVVLEALRALPPEIGGRVVVAFAGEGDRSNPGYMEELVRLTEEWGLSERVRWLGRREDVPDLFAAADAGLHASVIPEPFGLVMVECMALGTPVIAAQEGGASEIVSEETGWTYPGGDVDALSALLQALVQLPPHSLPSHASCISRAAKFDVGSMCTAVENVYRSVMRMPQLFDPALETDKSPSPKAANSETARRAAETRGR